MGATSVQDFFSKSCTARDFVHGIPDPVHKLRCCARFLCKNLGDLIGQIYWTLLDILGFESSK